MDEVAARQRLIAELDVSRETLERLELFVRMLSDENEVQNLVSKASLSKVWSRHLLDSAQLLSFAPSSEASWIDLGTGPGLPGIVIALLHRGPVTLVEERKRRVDFLQRAVERLALQANTRIAGMKAEKVPPEPYEVISARAFAPLDKLLTIGARFSTEKSRWVLPKGRNAGSELEAARASWQGDFRLEPSLTDQDAHIIVADRVKARGSKGKGSGKR